MTTFCTISAPACRLLTDLHSFGEIFSPSSHFDNRRRPESPVGTPWHDRCTHRGRAFIERLTRNWGEQPMTHANVLTDSVSPADTAFFKSDRLRTIDRYIDYFASGVAASGADEHDLAE